MKKVTKEVLDQSIYDLGWQKALDKWQLSDLQAENILFKKVPKERPEKQKIEKSITLDQSNVDIIWKVISKHYKQLRKLYVWYDTSTINVRSETKEDKFHNALIKIVEKLDKFKYIDDNTTLAYIKTRLFYEKRTDNTIDYRLNKEIKLTEFKEEQPNDND